MKATGAWEFFCIRFGCPVRGEKRAIIINIYCGSEAFTVNTEKRSTKMCRKFFRIFVCILLVGSLLVVPSFAESATVTGSRVNVRSGPGTDYYPVASIERNTVVDIVSRYNDAWYEINYNGILGFVSSAYLDVTGDSSAGLTVIQVPQNSAASVSVPASVPASSAGSIVSLTPSESVGGDAFQINAMYVRFRSGPGSNYSIVGEYNKGKEIKVVTTVGDWVAGYIDGNPGYVHKNYVSKGGAASDGTASRSAVSGGAASAVSGIVVLTPSPSSTVKTDLPQPNEGLVIVSPMATTPPVPSSTIVVLPQPDSKPAAVSPPPNVSADGVKGYIVGTYVRLRTGAGTNYSIIGTYNTGKELTAYANCGNGWLFCSIDGMEGYVNGSYVYIDSNSVGNKTASIQVSDASKGIQVIAPEAAAQNTVSASSGQKTGYIIGNNVRFRAGASMTSQILGELFYGNQVAILGTNGEWTKVVYEDSVGFVYSTYVKEGAYAAAEPVSSSAVTVSGSVSGQDIVNFAGQFLGAKYCWGGTSPDTGFDCSGFVYYVYKHFGITLSRVAQDQAANGIHVDPSDLRPGDILCFYSGSSYIGHAGIYIGGNKFIHSSNSTTGVIISELSGYYSSRGFEARRIVAK